MIEPSIQIAAVEVITATTETAAGVEPSVDPLRDGKNDGEIAQPALESAVGAEPSVDPLRDEQPDEPVADSSNSQQDTSSGAPPSEDVAQAQAYQDSNSLSQVGLAFQLADRRHDDAAFQRSFHVPSESTDPMILEMQNATAQVNLGIRPTNASPNSAAAQGQSTSTRSQPGAKRASAARNPRTPATGGTASAQRRLKRFTDNVARPARRPLLELQTPRQKSPKPIVPARSLRIAAQSVAHIPLPSEVNTYSRSDWVKPRRSPNPPPPTPTTTSSSRTPSTLRR